MNENTTMPFSIDQERYAYHLKNRRRKIIRLLICLIIWAIIFIYLLTPLSTVEMMHVKGNVYLKEDEILDLGGIKSTWWWLVDSKKLKSKLEEHENIDNVNISKGINGLTISILEKYPLAIKNDKYLMNSTELINIGDYPLEVKSIIDINGIDESKIKAFAQQYIYVDLSVRETFYKATMEDEKIIIIEGKFDENSYFKIKLNFDSISIKLSEDKFINIKNEILGKVNSDNVQYSQGNPCIVEYNFKNIYEYKIG